MRPLDGDFEPSDEVDRLRWLGPDEAEQLLDYDHDRELVAGSAPRLGSDT